MASVFTGFDGVYTTENTHDPFLPLAAAALSTERVELTINPEIALP